MKADPTRAQGVLTGDRERLAEALAIERIYGEGGPLWIAARLGERALAGDLDGVQRFRSIAAAYETLLGGRNC